MAIITSTTRETDDASLVYRGVLTPNIQHVNLVSWREGNENPRWQQIIADGGNATTKLEAYQDSWSITPGMWQGAQSGYAGSSGRQQGIQTIVVPTVFSPPKDLVKEATAVATTKAYSIINRLLSELQGQVFLGELRETVRLLKNPLAQSKKLFDAFYRKGRGKFGDEFAKSWLEFQFGIKPLLSDVDAIMGLINETIEKNDRKTFRAYGMAEHETVSTRYGMYDVYGFYQRINTHLSWKAEKIIRFAITQEFLEMANERKSDWRRQFDDLSAIPVTAWELTPFSFLVDYFVNVSDIIQAVTTSTAGVSYWSNALVKTAARMDIGSTDGSRAGYSISTNAPRVINTKRRWVSRDGAALGIPSVQFSLPGSNIRYLNIAALLVVLTAELRKSRTSRKRRLS